MTLWRALTLDSPLPHQQAVVEIGQRTLQKNWSLDLLRSELSQPHTFAGVLCDPAENCVLGYATMQCLYDELEIIHLVIDAPYRGQGMGRTLLNHILMLARQKQCRRILLEVRESNTAAIRLYTAAGFVVVGRRANYYSDTQEDALLLEMPIG